MSADKENNPNDARAVGILASGQVFIPLPLTVAEAESLRANLNAQLGAVRALDQIHALAGALQARRYVLHDPVAELDARLEEERRILHEREVNRELRETALYEAKLRHLKARHRFEAEEEFKDEKFGLGRARFAQRRAEAEVGEAVAREGLREEIIPPEEPAPRQQASMAHFARLVDELDVRIIQAEAAGESTEALRAEQEVLNRLLRRELLKEEP